MGWPCPARQPPSQPPRSCAQLGWGFSWSCQGRALWEGQPELLGSRMQLQPELLGAKCLLLEVHVLEVREYVDEELPVLVDGLGDGERGGVVHGRQPRRVGAKHDRGR